MEILSSLRKELKDNIDEHTKNTAQKFFKEDIKVYGIKTATVQKISENYFNEVKDFSKKRYLNFAKNCFLQD
jgi:3-methyladenine DNA glycosylase AlkD